MSRWLNNKFIRFKYKEIERPCKYCGYCVYGQLVEEFPFDKTGKLSCPVFGHNCPVYYHAESMMDEGDIDPKKVKAYERKIMKAFEEYKKKKK
jgi:hypothetical protein